MSRAQLPHPIPFNPARLRRDRWMRRTGYRLRVFAKVAPGLLSVLALVGFVVWLVRIIGTAQ